ncbi:MAG: SDR family oxidoreductase [Chloroflexota bacterium]|nr:SDR family oxidoreductase [Chloroflexota bacterium]
MELEGQAAIVTGAGRGIGRAIALELASMGADVVVAEMHVENGERVAGEVRNLGRRSLALRTDVTRRADLEEMVRRTMDEFGRIDVLVNNAGIYRAAPPLEIDDEHWDAVMDINAKAVFFASQAVLPHMVAAKRGNIINLASMAGKLGTTSSLPYAASKSAVISITRSLALSFASDGIRANCVCPGFVQTDMWTQVEQGVSRVLGTTPEELNRQRLAQIPLKRWEQPEDVARVVGFLASEKSGYITGEAVNVSGGLVMH